MGIGITGQTLKRMALPSATLQEVTLSGKGEIYYTIKDEIIFWCLHYDAIFTIENTKVEQVQVIRTQASICGVFLILFWSYQ